MCRASCAPSPHRHASALSAASHHPHNLAASPPTGKPGLIARRAGAVAVVRLPPPASAAGRLLLIGALHSYEDAGSFRAELLLSPGPSSNASCDLAEATVIASIEVETRWPSRTSQRIASELPLPDRVAPPAACRWARLTATRSDKVKLLDLTLL